MNKKDAVQTVNDIFVIVHLDVGKYFTCFVVMWCWGGGQTGISPPPPSPKRKKPLNPPNKKNLGKFSMQVGD